MKELFFKLSTLIKIKTCNHENIGEGWFVQQVRWRKCEDCGDTEVEGIGQIPFKKLVNKKYTNQRYRGK